MKKIYHKVTRYKQTGTNCGPNSLAQLLSFFDEQITPEELIEKTNMIKGLGTYDGNLGVTALALGYRVRVTPVNLYTFDPTWYRFPKKTLTAKLKKQLKETTDRYLKVNFSGFIDFLSSGGQIDFRPISKKLLIEKLKKHPILVGLCSTYLYRRPRTTNKKNHYRTGHFVIVNGYDPNTDKFFITDPWYAIPFSKTGRYKVASDELITAMHLGEATYDCTVLEVY